MKSDYGQMTRLIAKFMQIARLPGWEECAAGGLETQQNTRYDCRTTLRIVMLLERGTKCLVMFYS
jgi:hypothetical protein